MPRKVDTTQEPLPVLGPCACQACHSRVYWMGDHWATRGWYNSGGGRGLVTVYQRHRCTALDEPGPLAFARMRMRINGTDEAGETNVVVAYGDR
jgi:hypothetical protein